MAEEHPPPWGSPGSTIPALPLEPSGVKGRAGLMAFVDITRHSTSQTQMQVKCKLCERTMSGQNERMAAHFAQKSGCHVSKCGNSTPETVALGISFLAELAEKRGSTNSKKKRAREETNESGVVNNSRNTCFRLENEEGGGGSGENACDVAYMRFLVATGQSFGLGDSVHFREFLESARACADWTPRDRRTLRATDLDDEIEKVDTSSKKLLLAGNGLERGKTLQLDCWTGKDGRLRINAIESVDGKERFVTALDVGHNKDMSDWAGLFVGPLIDDSVDLVVCDRVCASMLKEIEAEHPRVTGLKCCAQGADLLLKDCCKLKFFASVIERVTSIVSLVKKNGHTLAIYLDKTNLNLISPRSTQVATYLISAMRMLKVKAAVKLFASHPRLEGGGYAWSECNREAARNVIAAINEGDALVGEFWFDLEVFVELMVPVYELLRMDDGTACMSKFFHRFLKLPERWDDIYRERAGASSAHGGQGWNDPIVLERLARVKEKGAHRLDYIWNPMMSAAFALDPEYRSVNVRDINGGQILADLHTIYERLLINHGKNSKAAIVAASEEADGGPVARAGGQFHLFKTGKWKGASLLGYAKQMSPADWWEEYGIGMPELAKVAIRVTSKSPALRGAERNWSLYGASDIAYGRRGRMDSERAKKLVFVRANLRLQSQDYAKKALVAWDPDSVESDGYMRSGSDVNDDPSDSDDGEDSEDAEESEV